MFNFHFCLLLPEEEEYYPRLSTKELAQHFEKTIEEAAPSKKIKVSLFELTSLLWHMNVLCFNRIQCIKRLYLPSFFTCFHESLHFQQHSCIEVHKTLEPVFSSQCFDVVIVNPLYIWYWVILVSLLCRNPKKSQSLALNT